MNKLKIYLNYYNYKKKKQTNVWTVTVMSITEDGIPKNELDKRKEAVRINL